MARLTPSLYTKININVKGHSIYTLASKVNRIHSVYPVFFLCDVFCINLNLAGAKRRKDGGRDLGDRKIERDCF